MKEYPKEELIRMYDKLKEARIFSEQMEKAVYAGLIRSSFHTPVGQEATGVGIVTAAKDTDWLGYTHRGQVILYDRYGMQPLITELFALRDGAGKGSTYDFHLGDYDPDGHRVLSMPGSLGSGVPQQTGFAFARKYMGYEGEVVIEPLGDGATCEGYVYEGWNMAALYKVPIVFVIENNEWGQSIPYDAMSADTNYSAKAAACGLECTVVKDGTDILEIREALDNAIEKARKCQPQVVEIHNLRWGPHWFGQPDMYRQDKKKVDEAMKDADCVKKYETYLLEKGVIDQNYIDAKTAELEAAISKCYEVAAKSEKPKFEDLYRKENIYASPETGGDL